MVPRKAHAMSSLKWDLTGFPLKRRAASMGWFALRAPQSSSKDFACSFVMDFSSFRSRFLNVFWGQHILASWNTALLLSQPEKPCGRKLSFHLTVYLPIISPLRFPISLPVYIPSFSVAAHLTTFQDCIVICGLAFFLRAIRHLKFRPIDDFYIWVFKMFYCPGGLAMQVIGQLGDWLNGWSLIEATAFCLTATTYGMFPQVLAALQIEAKAHLISKLEPHPHATWSLNNNHTHRDQQRQIRGRSCWKSWDAAEGCYSCKGSIASEEPPTFLDAASFAKLLVFFQY